tara:strand:- start:257 stop:562 length:306 start_codon:yes stop_codon:yes gene_type:complete
MKAIIDGKRYNTETATEVASRHHGTGNFDDVSESLYRTAKGAWFLAGSGGRNSSYAQDVDSNPTSGEGLHPLSDNEAIAWLETQNEVDALEKYFAESIEDA